MSAGMILIVGFLVGLAAACAVYYAALWQRVHRTNRLVPTLRRGLEAPVPDGDWPSICLIVPAHNESGIVATLVRSLLEQDYPGPTRFVFALDRCTDNTDAVIRRAATGPDGHADPRIEIVTVTACPDDWAGKVHAIHSAVVGTPERDGLPSPATADLLLFTDADTRFEPECLRAAVGLMHERRLDMLSLLPTLTRGSWFERIVQPAAGLELMRRYPLDRINRDTHSARFANGQFMLFSRRAYQAIGGHEAVHQELLEDLAFARRMRRPDLQMRGGVFLSDGLLACRMYASFQNFRRGWKRIYIESEHRHAERLVRSARLLRLVGIALPLGSLATTFAGLAMLFGWWDWRPSSLNIGVGMLLAACGAAALIAFGLASASVYRAQHLSRWWILAYPLGAWITAGIQGEAARDLRSKKPVEWAGRSYIRKPGGRKASAA